MMRRYQNRGFVYHSDESYWFHTIFKAASGFNLKNSPRTPLFRGEVFWFRSQKQETTKETMAATRLNLVVFLALMSGAIASPTIPVVMWSQKSGLFGPSDERLVLSDIDTELAMKEWVKSNTKSSPVELLITFNFEDNAVTTGLKDHSDVRIDIENARSSAVFPFLPNTNALTQDAMVDGDRFVASTWEEVLSFKSSHADSMSNGVCDLLVVELPSALEFNDQFVKLRSILADNVAFALPVQHSIPITQQYRSNLVVNSRRLATASDSPTKYVYMTPDLLAGILTGILLVMIALIGLSCLNSIQTPSQFSDKVNVLFFDSCLFIC